MDEALFKRLYKDFLVNEIDLDEGLADKLIKQEKKNRTEMIESEEKKSEEKELRHGTSCVGIVTKDETIVEF